MKVATLLAAQYLSSVAAINLVARDNPRVVGLDTQRKNVINPVTHDKLRRRQKTVQQALDNLQTLYFANATLGSPAQNFRLHVDTGSSDLWVNTASSRLCRSGGNQCGDAGVYAANQSTTYKYLNSVFNISYVDGSGASGDYATDTLRFGGKEIESMQFGIGYTSTSPEGILGIGYSINEVAVNRAGLQPYPNLPQKLADNGYINSNAYSLWLNDLDANSGNILFGGVDTEKYHGSLQTLPIIQESGVFAEFIIAMTALGANGTTGSITSGVNIPVLLDSGSSLMYLPDALATTLYRQFGAQYDSRQGAAFVDCKLANQPGSLDFTFSGATISVPMDELVVVAATSRGQPVCILGIGLTGRSMAVLGDTFLRSAYVVYDLANNKISLGQTNFNSTKENIQEIQAGANNNIPNATGVASAVPTGVLQTGGGRIHGPSVTGASRTGGVPIVTAYPWFGAAVAGVGIVMNGF